MSFDLFMDDAYPKCRKPIKIAFVEQHPTRGDFVLRRFECADCGAVKTKILF